MDSASRFWLPPILALALGLAAAPALAGVAEEQDPCAVFDSSDECSAPGNVAEEVFNDVFCDLTYLRSLPPGPRTAPYERTCRRVEGLIRRRAANARACNEQAIRSTGRVLKDASPDERREISRLERECRAELRQAANLERRKDHTRGRAGFTCEDDEREDRPCIDNCTIPAGDLELQRQAKGCTNALNFRGLCLQQQSDVAAACRDIGLCFDDRSATILYCDPSRVDPLADIVEARIEPLTANGNSAECVAQGLDDPNLDSIALDRGTQCIRCKGECVALDFCRVGGAVVPNNRNRIFCDPTLGRCIIDGAESTVTCEDERRCIDLGTNLDPTDDICVQSEGADLFCANRVGNPAAVCGQ